jgi:hypothetical protein
MEDGFLRIAAVIIGLGGIVYAGRILWLYLLKPLREFTAAQPVLIAIAYEFRPNSGRSLRDQIDLVNIRLVNIEQQLERYIEQKEPWSGEHRRHDDH